MQWIMLPRAGRRDVIAEVLSDRHNPTVDFVIRRNLIWTVKREAQRTYIAAYQLRHRSGYGWGFRLITETQPLPFHDCPIRFLDRTPVLASDWRRNVRAHHARRASRALMSTGSGREGRAPVSETTTIAVEAGLLRRLTRRTAAEIRGVQETVLAQLNRDVQPEAQWRELYRTLLKDLYADLADLEHLTGVTTQQSMAIVSCNGTFRVDLRGYPVGEVPEPHRHICRIDLAEWHASMMRTVPRQLDLLDVAYWYDNEGVKAYTAACGQFRKTVERRESGRVH